MTNLIEDAIAALRQVETLETREVHVGYENGMTSQAYVYEDYLPAKDVLAIVNATLARLEQAKGRAENETAWLIERDDIATVESGNRVCLHYYGEWRKGSHYWTPDHAKAKRFAMADEAMKETNGDPLLRVAEHMWMAVEQASSGEAGELVACSRCGGADMLMCDCSLPSRFAAPVAPQPVEGATQDIDKLRKWADEWPHWKCTDEIVAIIRKALATPPAQDQKEEG